MCWKINTKRNTCQMLTDVETEIFLIMIRTTNVIKYILHISCNCS